MTGADWERQSQRQSQSQSSDARRAGAGDEGQDGHQASGENDDRGHQVVGQHDDHGQWDSGGHDGGSHDHAGRSHDHAGRSHGERGHSVTAPPQGPIEHIHDRRGNTVVGHDHDGGHGTDHGHDGDRRHAPSHDHHDGQATGHDHGHDHADDRHGLFHAHAHAAPTDFGRAFVVGIVVNLGFVAVETVYGILANSVALLADAGHNLSDVAGLAAAWGATLLARRRPSTRFTYGLRGSSILAALFNAVLLLVAIGAVAWESVQRLVDPQPVAGATVIAVAAAGIAVNGFTAWLFARGARSGNGDLNVRAAFAHMLSDALVSAGVVVAGGVILLTGWTWLDPATSLVVAAIIVAGTWHLLRDSVTMALQGVPPGVEVDAVAARLAALPGVAHVHHVHIWPVSTTETALTAHLLCPAGHPGDAFLRDAGVLLDRDFGIGHATLQIETVAGSCA